MKDIYFIEVVGKEQKDKRGPFTYQQFKRMYEEKANDKLTYMSPIWNGIQIKNYCGGFQISCQTA